MNLYQDDGGGITVKSLKFWDQHKKLIGKVNQIEADRDYIECERKPMTGGGWLQKDYSVRITGNKGTILLSGCNCGYGGEGPNGTRQILEELGLTNEQARNLMIRKHIDLVVS